MEGRLHTEALRAEAAHVRVAETHRRAAELYERLGQPEKAARERGYEALELLYGAIERGRPFSLGEAPRTPAPALRDRLG